jgi:hypothetical protein
MRKTIAKLLVGLTFGLGAMTVVAHPAEAANIRPVWDRIVVKAQEDEAAKPRPSSGTSTGQTKTYTNPQG